MNRAELIAAIQNSPEWKESYRVGKCAVITKSSPHFQIVKFHIWGKISMGVVWGFCPKQNDEIPKRKEYQLFSWWELENWLNELDLFNEPQKDTQ